LEETIFKIHYISYGILGNSSLQATGLQPTSCASLGQRQNNCVHRAEVTKLLLLQHHVHNYFVYKHH